MSGDCPIFNFPCSKQKDIQHYDGYVNETFMICQSCPHSTKFQHESRCQTCGMSFDDLLSSKLFGCGDCYSFFENMAKVIIGKHQESLRHNGKTPACMDNMTISRLKNLMAHAIQTENYELAAKWKVFISSRLPSS